jgi:Class III cytochrome C family/Cytochrome c7 and related cytochrome c
MNHTRLGFLTPSGLLAAGITIVGALLFSIFQGGLLFNPGPLNAQNGSLVGNVISHAGIGGVCSKCHAPFWGTDRMTDRCLQCHTEISAQIADPKTLHGVFKQNEITLACQECHVEHNGPSAPLTVISTLSFPHALFGFALNGKHDGVECVDCHKNHDYLHTPSDCFSCHADKDIHAGLLGTDCSRCHTPDDWKQSVFDHSKSIFQLEGKHASLACDRCHTDKQFKGAPTNCAACHSNDDVHAGVLGNDCVRCHTPIGWKPSTFDHNTITFILDGKHTGVPCEKCHTDKLFKGTPTECSTCHARDDVHAGQLGAVCSQCHTTAGWKPSTFDHSSIAFKLTGRHAVIACEKCHTTKAFKGTPSDCFSCHAGDDAHNGQLGTNCGRCHTTDGWKPSTFDHNTSAFPLSGAHASAACSACHANNVFSGLPTNCYGCHAKDDPHGGRFGTDCGQCHSTNAWHPASFNHNLSSFPLTGAHTNLACTQCHVNNTFAGTPSFCAACHGEPAYHAGIFGTDCAQCHTTSNWSASYNGPHPNTCDGPCINHKNATCRDCHTVNLSTATCTKCHENNNP